MNRGGSLKTSLFFLLSLILLQASLVACGKDDTKISTEVGLVDQDLADIQEFNSQGAARVDSEKKQIFTKLFGGRSGADLLNFFQSRVKYWITDETEDVRFPNRFRYVGWLQDPDPRMLASLSSNESKASMMAANLSTEWWLHSLLEGVPVRVSIRGETVQVNSMRDGIIYVAPDYKETFEIDGEQFDWPAAYRQGVLIHEARHSDCTGGIRPSDIALLKRYTSYLQVSEEFPRKECGHLHSLCPRGHDLAALPACDVAPWGSYEVEHYFIQAAYYNSKNFQEQQILKAVAADTWDRILKPSTGDPDMGSSGLLGAS